MSVYTNGIMITVIPFEDSAEWYTWDEEVQNIKVEITSINHESSLVQQQKKFMEWLERVTRFTQLWSSLSLSGWCILLGDLQEIVFPHKLIHKYIVNLMFTDICCGV